jgi:RNA polymerase sigma-70 factor (ECF subfamily)
MKRNDEQLISDYLEGDDTALSILVDRYLNDLCAFAYSLTNDRQSAEDVAQEAFVKAWKNMRRFVPGNSFKGWLFRIARNTAIDLLRKKQDIVFSAFETEEGNVFLDTLKDTEPLPDELLERAENTHYLKGLLEQLNPAYREVLTLRYTSNMTFEEIGQIVGRPLHTVKSQYRRAITALQRASQVKPV